MAQLGVYSCKLKKTISIKGILIASLLFFGVAVLMSSFALIFSINPLCDENTVLLALGTGIFLLLVIKFSRGYLFEHLAIVIFSYVLYILPRIVTYFLFPGIVIWPFGDDINVNVVNSGLFYIFIGTIVFISGMMIADKIFSSSRWRSSGVLDNSPYFSDKTLITLFFFVFAVNFYISHIMLISPYGNMRAENYNTLIQFIRVILEFDSVFFIVFATLLLRKIRNSKNNWMAIITVVFCYILLTLMSGSRAGMLRTLIALMISIVIIQRDFRFKIGRWAFGVFLFGMVGLAIYPVATIARGLIIGKHYYKPYSFEYDVDNAGRNLRVVENMVAPVLNRLGWVLDYPILIVTHEGNSDTKEKYMNFSYPIKNIINMLVPGNPFQEAKIMTSRVVDVIYRGAGEAKMYSRYFSEYWTLWGLAYVYFDYLGGLLAILFTGLLIHSLYVFINVRFSGPYQFYLRLWFLFYVTQNIMLNMGFDSMFTVAFWGVLQFITVYFCLSVINRFYKMSGSFFKLTVKV